MNVASHSCFTGLMAYFTASMICCYLRHFLTLAYNDSFIVRQYDFIFYNKGVRVTVKVMNFRYHNLLQLNVISVSLSSS